jgi:maltose/maltodextrin transport system substrate-binding protein
MRRFATRAFTLAHLALALALAGQARAFEAGHLIIWVTQRQELPGLEDLARRFTRETGTEVLVARPKDAGTRFSHLAAAGAGPDIVISPHEPVGDWVREGLLVQVVPSPAFKQQIEDLAWQAVTLGGKTFAYPLTLEAVALIYNKTLVPELPKRFEDITALERDLKKRGKHALVWDYTTPQFNYPLLAANGGYTFKRQDDGEAALTINGPWAWDNLDRSGIAYGVTPLPSLNGKPARVCVSVVVAAISTASPNQDLAARFLERHLLTPAGLRIAAGGRPPAATALKEYQKELGQDPRRAATFASAMGGDPIPPIAEMADYWLGTG